MQNYYRLINEIPFCSLRKGSYIMIKGDNVYTGDGNSIIPLFKPKDILNKYAIYFELIYLPKFKINENVYLKGLKDLKGVICSITSFDCKTGIYEIRYNSNGRVFKAKALAEDLTPINMYWFLSSKGVVQDDIIGRDEFVEQWRKNTNNYFDNKEDCVKYREELIKKFK